MNETLKNIVDNSKRIVFLGGAGVSTASGIPDFRSANGIYKAKQAYGVPPETLLSSEFFYDYPEIFFDYYRKFLLYPDAKPNDAHKALAKLEQAGKLTAVITQNIDELHQRAGNRRVYELHGSVYRNHCVRCHRAFPLSAVTDTNGVPTCPCGGVIKPDVVLYGEGLDPDVVSGAVREMRLADTLIVGGTSLAVYPAAGLIDYFRGRHLVLINLSATPRDSDADLCVHEKIEEALSFVLAE